MTPRMQALSDMSNDLRGRRALVKAALHRGELPLADAMSDPAVQTMKIASLLETTKGMNPRRAGGLLLRAQVRYSRPVSELTERERLILFMLIRRRYRRVLVEAGEGMAA